MTGKYTAYGGKVDSSMERLLKLVVTETLKDIPEVPSILLCGGFGRGEGSVLIDETGNAQPLKDLDFLLVFNQSIPYDRIGEVSRRLRKKFRGELSELYPYAKFTIDLGSSTISRMNMYPDITTYEAKHASQVVFGEDIRDKIKITEESIPPRSGARILLQKGISMIGQLSTLDFIRNRQVPDDRRNMFIYECTKVIVELGTALSILGKIYDPSYRRRAVLLREQYDTLFPELCEKVPDLGERIFQCTNLKLFPDFSKIDNPILLWFSARKYHKEVLKYYLGRYLGIQDSNWSIFCLRMRDRLAQEFYRPLLLRMFQTKLGATPSNSLLSLANIGYQLYENFEYMKKIGVIHYISRRGARCYSPNIDFFVATLFILHSVQEDGSLNPNYIGLAEKALRLPSESSFSRISDDRLWDEIRSAYLKTLYSIPTII